MVRLRLLLPIVMAVALASSQPARGSSAFVQSEIEGRGSDILFSDLDGDRLKDIVLVDGLNLSIFYQDAKAGFPRTPSQRYRLAERPGILCPARLGPGPPCLLVFTSDGVEALGFPNRGGAATHRQLIRCHTVIPEKMDEPGAICFPLVVTNKAEWPLLLVPTAEGLQVWSAVPADPAASGADVPWQKLQVIADAVSSQVLPSVTNAGYNRSFLLNMTVADLNGDGCDDLMVRRELPGGLQAYALYFQDASGRFTSQPVATYTNQPEYRTALSWVDLNQDGHVDLIRSSFVDEPFFVPGMRAGKVFVNTCLADEHGVIPSEPHQVFRKNDWSTALPVVDVDGDGLPDLVLGYIPIDTREGFRKLLVNSAFNLNLRFHFSRPGGHFPDTPDYQRDTAIHIHDDIAPAREHRMYYEEFLSLNGDFNGDGKKDLLIRDRSDAISVYFFLSRETGFSAEPDLSFPCSETPDGWHIQDLNGDGRSDLVVKLRKKDVYRVFTSPTKAN